MKKQIKNTRNSYELFQNVVLNPQQLISIKGGNGEQATGLIGTEDVVDG